VTWPIAEECRLRAEQCERTAKAATNPLNSKGQPEAPRVMGTILCELCRSVPPSKLGPSIRVEACTIGIWLPEHDPIK
jgi:hypothetical protein